MADEVVKFSRGESASIPLDHEAGRFLVETDTGNMYLDITASARIQIKDGTKAPSDHTHQPEDIEGFTPSSVVVSDSEGKLTSSEVTSDKLNYLKEVTSDIQDQIDSKAPSEHTHTKSQITDFPDSLKNPNSLTFTGASEETYDGSKPVTVNIPTSGTVDSDLTIKLNNGSTEGEDMFTFDGSAPKTVNITPNSIDAASKSHTHNYAGSGSAGGAANSATKLTTPRTIRTNLASTSAASFDGSANVTPGVTGILGISNGGTGNSSGFVQAGKKSGVSAGLFTTMEGANTSATGLASHAEGANNTTTGPYSHSEGFENTSSGGSSHTEGSHNTAGGQSSHAEGDSTSALGNYSHAEGHGTITKGEASHVEGRYNVQDSSNKYAHIVGGGSSDTSRKNIHTLDWEGSAWFAGDSIKLGGTGQDDASSWTASLPKYTSSDVDKSLVLTSAGPAWKQVSAPDSGVDIVPVKVEVVESANWGVVSTFDTFLVVFGGVAFLPGNISVKITYTGSLSIRHFNFVLPSDGSSRYVWSDDIASGIPAASFSYSVIGGSGDSITDYFTQSSSYPNSDIVKDDDYHAKLTPGGVLGPISNGLVGIFSTPIGKVTKMP